MRSIEAKSNNRKFNGTIYVVAHEEETRLSMAHSLSREGYRVNLFDDGYDFVRWVQSNTYPSPDCLICDWFLDPQISHHPRIDAPDILRMAEHYLPQTPSLVMRSGNNGSDFVERAMFFGARGILYKPIEVSDLIERVRLLVRLHNNIEQSNIWSSAVRMMIEGGQKNCETQVAGKIYDKEEKAAVRAELKKPVKPQTKEKKPPAEMHPEQAVEPVALAAEAIPPPKEIDWSLASDVSPSSFPQGVDLLEEELVSEYAVSFEDLSVEFEDTMMKLEGLFEAGHLEIFNAAFELAQKGYRALHTLKGNAGFLKAEYSLGLIHRMEDVLSFLRAQPDCLTPDQAAHLVDVFLRGRDVLEGLSFYLGTYRCEAGYETTPAFPVYEEICRVIELKGKEIEQSIHQKEVPAGEFEEMF